VTGGKEVDNETPRYDHMSGRLHWRTRKRRRIAGWHDVVLLALEQLNKREWQMLLEVGTLCPVPDCDGTIIAENERTEGATRPTSSRKMRVWRCSREHDLFEPRPIGTGEEPPGTR